MRLEIQCEDRIGMVREILDLFIPHHIDLRLIQIDSKRRCIYCGFSDIPFSQLQILLAEIRRLDSIEDVKTIMFTPIERELNGLYTLLDTLPDGVISVDLKGQITMVTEQASDDLSMPIADLLYRPVSQIIKGINVSKEAWATPIESISKRIRIRKRALLLEMKPVFVSDEDGRKIPAGTVIYLKSELRLDKQTARLKQAPEAENHLEDYFQTDVIKSDSMKSTLSKAARFAQMSVPLFVQGEVGTGKRALIEALFQYWYKQQADQDAHLTVRHAKDITSKDLSELDSLSGWFVIEDVEQLDNNVQIELIHWLTRQSNSVTSFDSSIKIISVSSLGEEQLSNGSQLIPELYFSLSTLLLPIPSLRLRKEDIEGLVLQIVLALSKRHRLPTPRLSKGAITKLGLYPWPGNLKELQNRCLQTLLIMKDKTWQADDVSLPELDNGSNRTLINDSLDQTIKQWETELLTRLYPQFPSTRRLAKAVGMSHSTIANKLKEYKIGI